MALFNKVDKNQRASVKDVQTLINLVKGSRSLAVDGVLGPKTSRAIAGLPADQSSLVSSLVAARPGFQRDEAPAEVSISVAAIRSAIILESERMGLSPGLALTVCNAESRFVSNARSKTGASGLFQLTGSAIADVVRVYGSEWNRTTNRDEVDWNIKVGVRYLLICAGYVGASPRSQSVEDWSRIYACYNIGVGSYKHLLAKRFSEPSLQQAIASQASVLQRGGAPNYLSNALSYINSNVQRA